MIAGRCRRPAYELEDHALSALLTARELFMSEEPDLMWWTMACMHGFIGSGDEHGFARRVEHGAPRNDNMATAHPRVTAVTDSELEST